MTNAQSAPKSILFVFRRAPYDAQRAREGLDALLAAAVYEQDIAVLFLDDGVYQLHAGQQPTQRKDHSRMLSALPLYGVDRVYADAVSLAERGVDTAELLLSPTRLSRADTQALMRSFDHLLSF